MRVRHCHPTVTQVARDWDRTDEAPLEIGGLGDISGQCKVKQGQFGVDPKVVDASLPTMRITEQSYIGRGIGANALFPTGETPIPGARAIGGVQ